MRSWVLGVLLVVSCKDGPTGNGDDQPPGLEAGLPDGGGTLVLGGETIGGSIDSRDMDVVSFDGDVTAFGDQYTITANAPFDVRVTPEADGTRPNIGDYRIEAVTATSPGQVTLIDTSNIAGRECGSFNQGTWTIKVVTWGSLPSMEQLSTGTTRYRVAATARTDCGEPMPGGQDFTTLSQPEAPSLFHVGAGSPSHMPRIVAAGLADGTYAAIASGDAAGGLDLVHLGTGARTTNTSVDVSPAYGVAAYQLANGPRWTVYGGGGSATAGWNDSVQEFGGTFLGPMENTTQVSIADFDDDGVAESVVTTTPNLIRVDSMIIDGTAFAGGAPGAQQISAQFGRDASEVLVALADGRLFFGPVAGAAGRLALVGDVGSSSRLMDCAGTTPRVCVVPNYVDDTIHVVEIDATGARLVASQPTGDGPIGPSVMFDGARALIGVTGSGDNTFEVLSYDPAGEVVTVARPRETLATCASPNHVRLWTDTAAMKRAVIPCYGGFKFQTLTLGALLN